MSDTEEEIDIAAWIEQEIAALKRFRTHWEEGMARAPKHWPERLSLGEWDEQYRAWSEVAQEPEA
jgi:hypothetical protein